MSKHFHEHESELWELVQYVESLSDSTSLSIPSDTIPSPITEEQYDHAISLLKTTGCRNMKTFQPGFWSGNTIVVFRSSGLAAHGYIFLPDHTAKIFRYDPLGSDYNGFYDIE